MPVGGISLLFFVHQDPAVPELHHDANVSAGLIFKWCPSLGTCGSEQGEQRGACDGELLKKFQAGIPFLTLEERLLP
jgi:hypothetical protein